MRTLALALVMGAAAATVAAAQTPAKMTHVDLKNAAGASVGMAMISDAPNGVLMQISVKGLPPGAHGLHFHEKGDCSKSDFTTAGGHVHDKPTMVHGLLNPDANEAGDLPNLTVAADGTAKAEFFSTYVSMVGTAGRPALSDADGSAIVIHANADDHKTQPIGGAGPRIACGVIPPKG